MGVRISLAKDRSMVSPHHAQVVMTVLGTLSQVVSSRAKAVAEREQMMQQYALEELQAQTLVHVVDAVVMRRLDLVQHGFMQILGEYAAQARHYLDQQARYADAELDTFDPLRRVELRKRINDIDSELRQIRLDARRLYERMVAVLLALGGPRFQVSPTESTALMLTGPRG